MQRSLFVFLALISVVCAQVTGTWTSLGVATSAGVNGLVQTMTVFNDILYFAGNFDSTGTVSSQNLVRVARLATSATTPFVALSNSPNALNGNALTSLAVGNTWYIGGTFTQTNGTATPFLSAYDMSANRFSAFATATGPSDQVFALAHDSVNGDLYVGGRFALSQDSSLNFSRIAKYNVATQTWSALTNGGCDNLVSALHYDASTGLLWLGGNFLNCGGLATTRIATYNTTSGEWGTVPQGFNNQVWAFAQHPTTNEIYVGGTFTNTVPATPSGNLTRIARFNGTHFVNLGSGLDDQVKTMLFVNQKLYVGGFFNRSGSLALNRIGCWDQQQSRWLTVGNGNNPGVFSTLASNPRPSVNALAFISRSATANFLYLGGGFDSVGGITRRNNIIRFAIGATAGLAETETADSADATESGLTDSQLALAIALPMVFGLAIIICVAFIIVRHRSKPFRFA